MLVSDLDITALGHPLQNSQISTHKTLLSMVLHNPKIKIKKDSWSVIWDLTAPGCKIQYQRPADR